MQVYFHEPRCPVVILFQDEQRGVVDVEGMGVGGVDFHRRRYHARTVARVGQRVPQFVEGGKGLPEELPRGGAVIFVQRELRGEDEYRVVGGVARDARSDVFVVSPVGIGNELESEFVMARDVILLGTAEPFVGIPAAQYFVAQRTVVHGE